MLIYGVLGEFEVSVCGDELGVHDGEGIAEEEIGKNLDDVAN